jgi:hypothetical protein
MLLMMSAGYGVLAMEVVLTEAERVRRRELTRDSRTAIHLGLSLDQYRQQREAMISDWCEFLHAEMDRTHAIDPTEVIPQALARLEERAIAEARRAGEASAKEMVTQMLRKALL